MPEPGEVEKLLPNRDTPWGDAATQTTRLSTLRPSPSHLRSQPAPSPFKESPNSSCPYLRYCQRTKKAATIQLRKNNQANQITNLTLTTSQDVTYSAPTTRPRGSELGPLDKGKTVPRLIIASRSPEEPYDVDDIFTPC